MLPGVLNQDVIAEIANDVVAIKPIDDLEAEHKTDILNWLNSGENIFRIKKPDVPLKHLVAYFVLVDPNRKSILLVDHIKAQLWLPSGGHVEFNEHPKNTVVREAQEELNLEAVFLDNNDKPFFVTATETVGLTPGHIDVDLWYLLRGSVHDFLQYDKSEFKDTEWYTFDEILETDPVIFDPHLHRFARKLKEHLN